MNTFILTPPHPLPELPGIKFKNRSAAVSLMLNYDSRDSIFTPSNGIAAEIKLISFDDACGSDQDYKKYSAMFTLYKKLHRTLVLGLRGDGKTVDGSAPFYAYPNLDMRGLKAIQFKILFLYFKFIKMPVPAKLKLKH